MTTKEKPSKAFDEELAKRHPDERPELFDNIDEASARAAELSPVRVSAWQKRGINGFRPSYVVNTRRQIVCTCECYIVKERITRSGESAKSIAAWYRRVFEGHERRLSRMRL